MLSSRQSIGAGTEEAQLLQLTGLATLGSGKRFTSNCPAGEIAGTVVSTAPPVGFLGDGSHGFPLESTPGRKLVKSPDCSAALGTEAERALPRSSRFHS